MQLAGTVPHWCGSFAAPGKLPPRPSLHPRASAAPCLLYKVSNSACRHTQAIQFSAAAARPAVASTPSADSFQSAHSDFGFLPQHAAAWHARSQRFSNIQESPQPYREYRGQAASTANLRSPAGEAYFADVVILTSNRSAIHWPTPSSFICAQISCTHRTTCCTFSTGVAGTIPWPTLKICPGFPPACRNTSSTRARKNLLPARTVRWDQDFPAPRNAGPTACLPASRGIRQSSPITSAPVSRMLGSNVAVSTPK